MQKLSTWFSKDELEIIENALGQQVEMLEEFQDDDERTQKDFDDTRNVHYKVLKFIRNSYFNGWLNDKPILQ